MLSHSQFFLWVHYIPENVRSAVVEKSIKNNQKGVKVILQKIFFKGFHFRFQKNFEEGFLINGISWMVLKIFSPFPLRRNLFLYEWPQDLFSSPYHTNPSSDKHISRNTCHLYRQNRDHDLSLSQQWRVQPQSSFDIHSKCLTKLIKKKLSESLSVLEMVHNKAVTYVNCMKPYQKYQK